MTGAGKLAAGTAAALLAALGGSYAGYVIAFRRGKEADVREIPEGEQFTPYKEVSLAGIDALLALPCEHWTVRSFDGLRLSGRYYAGEPDKPLVIFFHGYRSGPIRDASGGFRFCRREGCSVLMVDQRSHGESEGKTIAFGALEKHDCVTWAQEAARRDPSRPILLAGVSMGAATVLSASELPLPGQVKGIWADCGYADTAEILRCTIKRWHMPVFPTLQLTELGARIFGGFRVRDGSAVRAVRNAKVPVLLIHGEGDGLVPCDMAGRIAEACASSVTLLTVPGAGHGMSYYADTPAYTAALETFFAKVFGGGKD